MGTQATLGLSFFYWFPVVGSPLFAIPSIIATTYYPFAKRHTNYPQVVLGFCLSWGVVIGALAFGVKSLPVTSILELDRTAIYLLASCAAWAIINDTIYAQLDLEDDIRLGVGSIAVLTQGWAMLAFLGLSMIGAGVNGQMGYYYYGISVVDETTSLTVMIAGIDLGQPSSIGWWFSNGLWSTGISIAAGLLAEYLFSPLESSTGS